MFYVFNVPSWGKSYDVVSYTSPAKIFPWKIGLGQQKRIRVRLPLPSDEKWLTDFNISDICRILSVC